MLVTTTDAFTMEDLLTGEKTAIIIHADADNFANIPPERYSRSTAHPVPTRPRWPPVTPASGWRAVSSVPASDRSTG